MPEQIPEWAMLAAAAISERFTMGLTFIGLQEMARLITRHAESAETNHQ